jgi:flagellar assembly protein FliH
LSTEKQSSGGSGLSAALSEAQAIVEAAKRRAAEITSESDQIARKAYDEGYEKGFAQGQADSAGTAVRLVEEMGVLGERLSAEAARLAIAISSTVIGEQVKVDPDFVRTIARRAFEQSIVGDAVTVFVNPEDEPTLQGYKAELRRLSGGAGVAIEANPAIARGGCLLKTEFGEVDASIDAFVDAIRVRLGVKKNER